MTLTSAWTTKSFLEEVLTVKTEDLAGALISVDAGCSTGSGVEADPVASFEETRCTGAGLRHIDAKCPHLLQELQRRFRAGQF